MGTITFYLLYSYQEYLFKKDLIPELIPNPKIHEIKNDNIDNSNIGGCFISSFVFIISITGKLFKFNKNSSISIDPLIFELC